MKQILSIAEHITVKDFFDIFIVSLIIYKVLNIIRGTRAVQMLIGLFGIAILYWVSHSYKLYSLNWVLNHFFDYFLVIFIILFQEQIRGLLSTFGNTKFWGKTSAVLDQSIEEIVESCGALSRENTGALIVIEQRNGLLNYMSTGTGLDSEIHSDILYSIFQSNSPLHDGAVIISNDRVKAAGCFLPLSKNVEIDRHLGTRHRAALGISEVSDAVVITVSEETGDIKVCFNSVFYQMKDELALRRQLKRILSGVEIKTEKIETKA